MSVSLFLLIVALVMFILVAANVPAPPRMNWLGVGLALWVLSIIIGGVGLRM